jgi:hypothetical protein
VEGATSEAAVEGGGGERGADIGRRGRTARRRGRARMAANGGVFWLV